MIKKVEPKIVYARTRKTWRAWLQKNHQKEKSVWLIIHNKNSTTKCVNYEEAVEESLCFGWVDSIAKKRDDKSHIQYFSQRKAKSNWSKSNKERVARLIEQGLMHASGQAMIDLAKKSGTWAALEKVQRSILPEDLKTLFLKNKIAEKYFQAFPPSSKRIILEWIQNAKKPETRKQRIKQTVLLAAKNLRANHYPK
ncbi:MAG: YdeI/OmpD-associated family protein [Bacteroidetes bacterium]|nr:YdeI/OmpD-associated family protein [Bacteroidota bacterium]